VDKLEASELLAATVDELRKRSRAELEQLLHKVEVRELRGPSGNTYQLEADASWDDRKGHNLRIFVSIDDGGWRAVFPMSQSFIVAPDGSFVGE
jgi:hypothetical protein